MATSSAIDLPEVPSSLEFPARSGTREKGFMFRGFGKTRPVKIIG